MPLPEDLQGFQNLEGLEKLQSHELRQIRRICMFVENHATKGMYDPGQGRIPRCVKFILQTYDLSEVWKGNIG